MLDENGSSCELSFWKIFYAIFSCCFTFNLSTMCLYFCSINVFPLLTSQTALSVFFLKSHVTPGTAAFTSALQTQRQKYVDAEWSEYHVSTQCSFQPFLTSVASVSVRFRSKQLGAESKIARVKELGGAGKKGRKRFFLPSPPPPPSFFFWLSFHFSCGQNRKSRYSVFLWSETKRRLNHS